MQHVDQSQVEFDGATKRRAMASVATSYCLLHHIPSTTARKVHQTGQTQQRSQIQPRWPKTTPHWWRVGRCLRCRGGSCPVRPRRPCSTPSRYFCRTTTSEVMRQHMHLALYRPWPPGQALERGLWGGTGTRAAHSWLKVLDF